MKKMITTEMTSKAVRPRVERIAIALTVIEFLILQALASRPGIVKSRDALMVAAQRPSADAAKRESTSKRGGSKNA